MRFVKTYWLEMLMVIPLFAYIIGFTLLPILTNIKESFIDQRFGRRYDILVSKIADIKYDLEQAQDAEEQRAYEKELAETALALERLQHSPYASFSLSNYLKLFKDRSFVKAIYNTIVITLMGLSLQLVIAMARVLRHDWMSILSHAILRPLASMARRHLLLSHAIATNPRLCAQSGCCIFLNGCILRRENMVGWGAITRKGS